MLPPLKVLKAGLRRTTEALAAELATPSAHTPDWSPLEWQLAAAVAAAHGVSPLLCKTSTWDNPGWRSFLESQQEHVTHRHGLIATLLERLDAQARAAALPLVPLKGSALHALGLYRAGERPMADIDLLVRESDSESATVLLQNLGYVESPSTWKHRVFKPAAGKASLELGEHRDNQITVELHTCIREPLPVTFIDITSRVYARAPQAGLNPYPSNAALMSHLLLHTAGNLRVRTLRLVQLNDIARFAARMAPDDWNNLWDQDPAHAPWWALPPLRLAARYFRHAIPDSVLTRLESDCPPLLRMVCRRQTLTHASCSGLWIQAVPGLEWARSVGEACRLIRDRIMPSAAATQERMDAARSNAFLETHSWATLSRRRQILVRLTRPIPRADTLHVVRSAFARQGMHGP